MINWIICALAIWIGFLIYLTMTDQRVHYHDQNLTDGRLPMWRHGRCWWYITPRDENKYRHGPGAHAEWSILPHDSGATLDITVLGDEGEDIELHIKIPYLISLWFTLERLPLLDRIPYKWRRTYGYETSIKWHSGTLWLHVFHTDAWGSGTAANWLPRWIHVWRSVGYKEYRGVGFYISFDFDRLILGSRERTEENIGEPIIMEIPIEPDNQLGLRYYATFQRQVETRWRSHLPWRKRVAEYWEISTDNPPMHAGKGENSWDQDDDGIMGCSVAADTVEDAVRQYVEKCQRDREKYGLPDAVDRARRGTL